jgi:hypothetical protein
MKHKQDGTKKWCPHCRNVTVNKVRLTSGTATVPDGRATDPLAFQRVLSCGDCGREWRSAEIPVDFLKVLFRQRRRLELVTETLERIDADRDNLARICSNLEQLKTRLADTEPVAADLGFADRLTELDWDSDEDDLKEMFSRMRADD